jgi:uncharacterized protein
VIFVLICKDKPGHLQTRVDTRPDHVAYLNGLNEAGRLKFAGPFLDTAGQPSGSMIAVEAKGRAEAEAIAADDPYSKAGLFESVTVQQWNWVFNNPDSPEAA